MIQANTAATFDIDALLHPIAGDRPGGDVRAYARGLRAELAELRNPPRSANPDDEDKDGGADCVDWTAITMLATEALCEKTKDLRIACHLTEAAMQHWGIAGLRDGFILLRRMVEEFWDTLAPELDPDDPDARCSPLENLLDDPNRGPRIPSVLRNLPILQAGEHKFSLMSATRQTVDLTSTEIAAAIRQVTVEDACQLSDELDQAIDELASLHQAMTDRMNEYAPSFVHLEESLKVIRQWLDAVLKPQFESRDIVDAEEAPEPRPRQVAAELAEDDPLAVVDQSRKLRTQAYQQLSEAARILQQIEPHSPIPFMIRRAVQLGQLPFPKLMRQLVNEESTLEMFHRELGLSRDDDEASGTDD
ncbi:MAG: type VI secretion system protein TssA [Pirellulaceae bacterium]